MLTAGEGNGSKYLDLHYSYGQMNVLVLTVGGLFYNLVKPCSLNTCLLRVQKRYRKEVSEKRGAAVFPAAGTRWQYGGTVVKNMGR